MAIADRIERRTEISAPARTVWELISEPGWFINDGALVEHRLDDRGDGVTAVHDPVHGEFLIRTETLDPPRYAAFRWIAEPPDPDHDPAGSGADGADRGAPGQSAPPPSTLVEFWIEEAGDATCTLRVVESGFSSLPGSEAERRRQVEENTQGWEEELALARAHAERASQQEEVR
ncbi:hypothetical protein [Brevibacterium daeguense]|nr:hypothetical protein [Brevibacterium daeguense]